MRNSHQCFIFFLQTIKKAFILKNQGKSAGFSTLCGAITVGVEMLARLQRYNPVSSYLAYKLWLKLYAWLPGRQAQTVMCSARPAASLILSKTSRHGNVKVVPLPFFFFLGEQIFRWEWLAYHRCKNKQTSKQKINKTQTLQDMKNKRKKMFTLMEVKEKEEKKRVKRFSPSPSGMQDFINHGVGVRTGWWRHSRSISSSWQGFD